ncbi:protein of unknown function [Tepidibacter aestuarii]|nr:protein of unknown function [Tepidibacter aestuarii]
MVTVLNNCRVITKDHEKSSQSKLLFFYSVNIQKIGNMLY